jgi:hypothetical protein
MTWDDLVDLKRPGQKPGCNLLTFYIFYQNNVVLSKNFFDPGDPVKTRDPGLGSG